MLVAPEKDHMKAMLLPSLLFVFTVYAYSQIGDGTRNNASVPIKVMENVKHISAGSAFSLVVQTDGTLWACGNNDHGQLGIGTNHPSAQFIKIMDNVKTAFAGWNHSVVIKNDGSLWTFGSNQYGELGDGSYNDSYAPKKILDNVTVGLAGANHTIVLMQDGSVWGFGNNDSGQLGNNNTTKSNIPIKIINIAQAIAVGQYHTLVLLNNGNLVGMGWNAFNQLNNKMVSLYTPTLISSNVVSIYSNPCSNTTLFKINNGDLYGLNYKRSIIKSSTANGNSPELIYKGIKLASVGLEQLLIINDDNTLLGIGGGSGNDHGLLGQGQRKHQEKFIKIMENVKDVSAGIYHTMILMTDDTLWACGYNGDGSLM
jgi:alpha-tubulin suppressor-like RCC1 family protein